MGLIDLGYTRLRFTECNNHFGIARVWETIDRSLVTADWFQHFLGQGVAPFENYVLSLPILITIDGSCLFREPFKFEKFWTFYVHSWDLIRKVWRMLIHADAIYWMIRRLELARRRLLRWNCHEVDDIFRCIKGVEADITEL